MKKILILIMSCQAEFFTNEVKRICSTWGKDLPDDMMIGYYDGGWQNGEIVDEDGILHVKSEAPDDLQHTYLKTYDALRMMFAGDVQFDYIMRVNTSTWVNTKLLRKFVDEVAQGDVLYASELYSLTEAACPEPLCLYARGNAMIMSREMAGTIIREGLPLLYANIVDDVAIGNILNSYFIKTSGRYDEYLDHIKSVPHGWYRCIDKLMPNNHALCRYGEDGDQAFYNEFMTVQTKMYRNREREHDNMEAFYEMMKDAPEPSLRTTINYMQNPSVFIGSALGYISYENWVKVDKGYLYRVEMGNKAIDDKQNPHYSEKMYKELHSVPGMNHV